MINNGGGEAVRHIFQRYAALGSVRTLREELATTGLLGKRRINRFGRETGGKAISHGTLYLMLQNRVMLHHGFHPSEARRTGQFTSPELSDPRGPLQTGGHLVHGQHGGRLLASPVGR